MDPTTRGQSNSEPMGTVSYVALEEDLKQLRVISNKYLSGSRNLVAIDVLKEAIGKDKIIQHKINLLKEAGENEAAAGYHKQWMKCRKWIAIPVYYLRQREMYGSRRRDRSRKEEGTTDTACDQDDDEENVGHEQGISGKAANRAADLPTMRDAQNAIAKHIRVCKKVIRDHQGSWVVRRGGRKNIDTEYMEARDIVKEVIQATTSDNKDQAEDFAIEPAERLLVTLRKDWLHSRHYFDLKRLDHDYWIDGLDEEEEMGLV
ncbi:hypothetical protein F4803DRAFT_576843 [Xylaria telfairii]|nr:hypothetical protein F4803DRAFT_576843 [Xylaria telfairii]